MRRFVFLMIAQLFELLSFFKPLNNKRIIFNSTENRNFNFNSKYLFLYFLKHAPELELYFVINDDVLRRKLSEEYGEYFISSENIKGLWLIANAKLWITSVLETPFVPFYILRNRERFLYHIGHGVPLKKIVLDEEKTILIKKINRYLRSRLFTHVLSYSECFTKVMKRSFKNNKITYVPLGQPRNDALQCHTKREQLDQIKKVYPDLPRHKQAILYAPTWRSYDTVKFFPFENLTADELNERLIENDTVLFLRKHPYFPSLLDQSFLEQSNIYLFDSDLFPEIMDYLSYFDKLITDYSSIYLDFLCLDRPMAFIPYDIEQYTKYTGFTIPYEEFTPGKHISNKEEFYNFITNKDDEYSIARAEITKLVNAKPLGNCEENYQFIQELLKK